MTKQDPIDPARTDASLEMVHNTLERAMEKVKSVCQTVYNGAVRSKLIFPITLLSWHAWTMMRSSRSAHPSTGGSSEQCNRSDGLTRASNARSRTWIQVQRVRPRRHPGPATARADGRRALRCSIRSAPSPGVTRDWAAGKAQPQSTSAVARVGGGEWAVGERGRGGGGGCCCCGDGVG